MTDPYVTMSVTTATCPRCRTMFTPIGRAIYCSAGCRQAAYRRRNPTPAPPPTQLPEPAIVYECVNCQRRYLDERRCPDCNLYCRRLGPGGPCPHCDEPVARTDLDQ